MSKVFTIPQKYVKMKQFEYETYDCLISRTSITDTWFLYNERDGVMSDANGLYYIRARYYSPELKRFINADVVAGDIANAITLNRYAYANGNPVSNIDPFGLSSKGNDSALDKAVKSLLILFTPEIKFVYGFGMHFSLINRLDSCERALLSIPIFDCAIRTMNIILQKIMILAQQLATS